MRPDALDGVLEDAVARGAVPHAVAVAADRSGSLYEGAAGPRVAGDSEAANADTHFLVMSMTKLVATLAALQLHERGVIDLAAPVERYCPAFAELQVLDGFDGDVPRLRPPATKATVSQLITHTSGLGYSFWDEQLIRWETVTGTPEGLSGSRTASSAPLLADPGTRFAYGISPDWLGRVIEAASGVSLDVAVKESITGPLGMDRTTFEPTVQERANLAPVHVRDGDGRWQVSPVQLGPHPEDVAGGHGLYSTPRDYLTLQRALLCDGSVDGVRILRPDTVEAAFINQIGALRVPELIRTGDPASSADFHAGPGQVWGYGLMLNTRDLPGRRRAWSGAWAGLCNTHFWVDRTSGVTGAVYTQTLPFAAPEVFRVYTDAETALYASL